MNAAVICVAAFLLAAPPQEQGDYVRLTDCTVTLIDDVLVPARETGVLTELHAREGTVVTKGDLLGLIDQSEALVRKRAAEYQLKVAEVQAESNANVNAATATEGVAQAEYEEALAANSRTPGAYSELELRRLHLTVLRAGYQKEVAILEKEVANLTRSIREAELQAVEQEIQRRRVESPIDGVVIQRLRNIGEWVTAGDPIFRIVRMNRLRFQGRLDANRFLPEDVLGKKAKVVVRLKEGKELELWCEIVFASPVVDGSQRFDVFAEFDNPRDASGNWVVRPGLRGEMWIALEADE